LLGVQVDAANGRMSVVMRQSVVTWLANPLRLFAKSGQRSTVLAAFVTENTSAHPAVVPSECQRELLFAT